MGRGLCHPSGSLVRVPIGTSLIDAGSAAASTYIQPLNGSTFNASTATALYSAWKAGGFLGAKDASFNASSSPVITASGYTGTSGGYSYTITKSTDANSAAWKAFDDNSATYWGSTAGYYLNEWIQVELSPSIVPFSLALQAGGAGTADYMTGAGIISGYDGSEWDNLVIYEGLTWTNNEIKAYTPLERKSYSKFLLNSHCVAGLAGTYTYVAGFRIFGADLSVIKCTSHGFSTGTAVRCGVVSGETIPTGITADTTYYVREGADAHKLTLYDTSAHATAGGATGLISITGAGSGAFKIYPYPTISLSTVSNGKLYY